MTCHYMMSQSVRGVTQMEVRLRLLGPLFLLGLQNHSDMSQCDVICQHLSETTEPQPFLQEHNATAHTAKNSIPCLDSVFW